MKKKMVLVSGGGGFIGGHLVKKLIEDGFDVKSVDIKPISEWHQVTESAINSVMDLQKLENCMAICQGVDDVYNLAADMGGIGFIENNKALCMLSVLINTHLLQAAKHHKIERYLFTSSACAYNTKHQHAETTIALKESDAYPAMPEDGYGWEKLFSERMCRHFLEDFGLSTRVVRLHNVYGPFGTWNGGREKAPAAICRKVVQAIKSGKNSIEIWGDGQQTRSFMFIDDCIEGLRKIMESSILEPINLGSSELISINDLVSTVEGFAGTVLKRDYKLTAPKGVKGRNSDNTLIKQHLDWQPDTSLSTGMKKTYRWILDEYERQVL